MNFIFNLLGTIWFWFLIGLACWSALGFVFTILIYRDWNRKFYCRLSVSGENLVYLIGGPLVWSVIGLIEVLKKLKEHRPTLKVESSIFKV